MNEEKIDEMAKDLCHTETCEIKKIGIPCNHRCKAHIYATRAIDKGYRKASELAEEIFSEIGKILYHYDRIAERDKSEYGELIVGDIGCAIAELKKKYTEEGK